MRNNREENVYTELSKMAEASVQEQC